MKFIHFILFCLCASSAQAQRRFSISGQIAGVDTGTVRLSYATGVATSVKLTAPVKNGRFTISDTLGSPAEASLKLPSGEDPVIYIEPVAMTVKINDLTKRPAVTGSRTHAEWESLQREKAPLGLQVLKIDEKLTGLKSDTTIDEGKREKAKLQLSNLLDKTKARMREMDLAFIHSHPGSVASAYLLDMHFMNEVISLDAAEKILYGFAPEVRRAYQGRILAARIAGRKNTVAGMPAPDFEMPDSKGDIFRLSDYRHKKVVLLDFWASWCAPCRELTPGIKALVKQYESKGLLLTGVSWDFSNAAWKKALAADGFELGRQLHGFVPPHDGLRTAYGLRNIPTLILIGKDGIILGRYNSKADWPELEKAIAAALL